MPIAFEPDVCLLCKVVLDSGVNTLRGLQGIVCMEKLFLAVYFSQEAVDNRGNELPNSKELRNG